MAGPRFQAISPRAAALRSLTQLVPPTELMQGACLRYGNSSSDTAPRMKSATSARLIDPAWSRQAKNNRCGAGSREEAREGGREGHHPLLFGCRPSPLQPLVSQSFRGGGPIRPPTMVGVSQQTALGALCVSWSVRSAFNAQNVATSIH